MSSRRRVALAIVLPMLLSAALDAQTVRRAPTAVQPPSSVTRDPTYVPPPPPPPAVAQENPALVASRSWEMLPGCAKAIAAGRAEQLFVLGCAQADANGWTINYWDPNGRAWFPFPGGSALQIEAHPDGRPFVIRGNSRAYQWRTGDQSGFAFIQTTLDAAWRAVREEGDCWKSIAVSRDAIWRVTCQNAGAGGYGLTVYPLTNRIRAGFVPGAVERVAANDATRESPGVWAIGSGGAIWRSVPSNDFRAILGWQQAPGCAKAIAAGAGHVLVIGCDEPDGYGDRSIWRWNGNDWIEVPGRASDLAVTPEGIVYAVSGSGAILRMKEALPPITESMDPRATSGTKLP
jgi:hypothetical protein